MKKLLLEAYSPTEAIGIVRSGYELRLIRPPYSMRNSPMLEEASLHAAIQRAGFIASHTEFRDWNEIIQFLNDQIVRSRQDLGYGIPNEIRADDVFDIATHEALTELLDRLDKELLLKQHSDVVENILVSFLAHETSHRFSELGSRAARMLKNLKTIRETRNEECDLLKVDRRFSSLLSHGTYDQSIEIANKIRTRGSVFCLTS